MRHRKSELVEHENTDRWLISYADFITLLFAFFVVMYAISSVNIGKYQVISNTLDAVFNEREASQHPIQVGDFARAPTDFTGYNQSEGTENSPMKKIASAIAVKIEVDNEMLQVREGLDGVEIELNDTVLFISGGAELNAKAVPILHEISKILNSYPNAILVEGFTDNLPIDNIFYPSNWDLSVARSATVVRELTKGGIDPTRIGAVGYAEFQPIASNVTPLGRGKNRRVIIKVLARVGVRVELTPLPTISKDFVGPVLPVNKAQNLQIK